MRNILLIFSLLFLFSCTTGEKLISSGKIQKGLSKQDMRGKFMSSKLSEDPFLPEGGRLYFRDTKTEIIYPSSKSYFYVFTNVFTIFNIYKYPPKPFLLISLKPFPIVSLITLYAIINYINMSRAIPCNLIQI